MTSSDDFEIFLVAPPGLERFLLADVREKGWSRAKAVKGGVTLVGGWKDVWRANLELRGASRVIARIAQFRVLHLAQLDKRARKIPWHLLLRKDVPFSVDVSCTKSRIYHSGAAAERIRKAIAETLGAPYSPEAEVCVKARIEDDLCTVGIDTSGDLLHKRGHKEAVNKAPMRETLASLFLRACGYDGTEPVLDPMCGSGTFVIEAAEIAMGLKPGRSRHFAFERLATFDAAAWQSLRGSGQAPASRASIPNFVGFDRDAGAIEMCHANAARAGIAKLTRFHVQPIENLEAPDGASGLVIVNPPYGERIGDRGNLIPLYRTLGERLRTRFKGWRAGVITSDADLARATGLAFSRPCPHVSHGGIRVTLYLTGPIA